MTLPMRAGLLALTLDELSVLRSGDLETLYREGDVPERFSALNGRPRGRVLAVRHLESPFLFALSRAVTGSRLFPWEGKNFASTGKRCGGGQNRINLLVREFDAFAFRTRVEKSMVDGKPCLLIDYSQGGNPWPLNKIRDELREVSPGLYLGPSLWRRDRNSRPLLWFAIDARLQC